MRSYRKHLSGEAAFKSFVPTPLSEIQVIHTEELDKLIMETESAMQQFNDDASQLSEEQIKQLMWQEAENSCKLATLVFWLYAGCRQFVGRRYGQSA